MSSGNTKAWLKSIVEGELTLTTEDATLVKQLSRSAGQVTRELAIRALTRVVGFEGVEIARGYLGDTFRHYRAAAAFTLGEIGDESDLTRLNALQSDSALAVRQAASAALGRMRERGFQIAPSHISPRRE